MKVNVNIINTCYILMSEAVTLPRLVMMMTSIEVSEEESIAREGKAHIQTHRHGHAYVHFFSKSENSDRHTNTAMSMLTGVFQSLKTPLKNTTQALF